jgi:hypothetical protein
MPQIQSQDVSVYHQGISIEQAKQEPDLLASKHMLEMNNSLLEAVDSSGAIDAVTGSAVSGHAIGLLSKLIPAMGSFLNNFSMQKSTLSDVNPCEKWHLSKKGCIYLESLIKQERLAQDIKNYHGLIFYLSLLLEHEMLEIIVKPLQPFAPEISEILKSKSKRCKTSALEAWAKGDIHPTFWTLVQVLQGIEIGGNNISKQFNMCINSLFYPEYRSFIQRANISRAADTFRRDFRNPCCHPVRSSFTRGEAERACVLILGSESVVQWLSTSADKDSHSEALLSTHLSLKKN